MEDLLGSPVVLSLGSLWQLFLISWFCNEEIDLEVIFSPVSSSCWQKVEGIKTIQEKGAIHMWFPLSKSLEYYLLKLETLEKTVWMCEGELEFITKSLVESEPAGNHHYKGKVRERRWSIQSAYPPVQSSDLKKAILFNRTFRQNHAILVGKKLVPLVPYTLERGRKLFLERFSSVWDMAPPLPSTPLSPSSNTIYFLTITPF